MIIDVFKQLLNRRDREKLFSHGYGVNRYIPKGYALRWAEVHKKKHKPVGRRKKVGTSVLDDSGQFAFYSKVPSYTGDSLLYATLPTAR